jgi:2,4-dienoyl-CoA reductase-like NADH-dependent reductase (Old Yellow Enzyme family)/thioredoxin reductase
MSYQRKYPHLFSPYTLGNRIVRNRIIAAPSSIMCIEDIGKFTDDQLVFWELKAQGGAAIVTYGEAVVDTETGQTKDRSVLLDNPHSLPHLAKLAKKIKRHGALANIELYHGGKYAGFASIAGENKPKRVAYGASAESMPEGDVLEMPDEIIMKIIESFGKAAAYVKRAGFDMVMIHGAHGWLFNQFLSQRTNHRTDRFGGSFENRARMYTMVLDSMRQNVGAGFPIEVRMNGSECLEEIGEEGGLTLEDALHLAKLIEPKCDLINVSAGLHEDVRLFGRMIPSQFLEPGLNVPFAEAVKKEVKNVAVSCVGAINDPKMMEEIIATCRADFIEIGRGLLADPYLPRKAELGLDEREIAPCLCCNNCMDQSAFVNALMECAVNPIIGHERDDQIRRGVPTAPKRVLIAGGGPAGMQLAITAAERGHNVVLCEKTAELGGAIRFAEHVSFKKGLDKFNEHLKYLVAKAKIDVRLNTPVSSQLVDSVRPDVLFVAIGSAPVVPYLPGIESENVLMAQDLYGNEALVGQNVVVLGGGLVGCETAAHLGRIGRSVTVVEMLDGFAGDSGVTHKAALKLELDKSSVKVMTATTGVAITGEGLLCRDKNGEEVLYPADAIVCAVGYASTDPLIEELRSCAPEVHVVGDADSPGKLKDALSMAYWMALDI